MVDFQTLVHALKALADAVPNTRQMSLEQWRSLRHAEAEARAVLKQAGVNDE